MNEACIVPFRLTSSGVQFCLLSPTSGNRWEFPKIALERDANLLAVRLQQLAESVGIEGSLSVNEPLDQFEATRGDAHRTMVAFLMHVVESASPWPSQDRYRRLWCLPEEARVRLRRKPLRRFIDLALHGRAVQSRAASFSAVGHAVHSS